MALRKNNIIKLVFASEMHTASEKLIASLAKKLDIYLGSPDQEIVKQGEFDEHGMFII